MSYETNDKMVSHPDHYKSGKYEVIDIIDEFCKDLTGTEAVCTANAIKYILRWKKKNGVQDLKKAVWYLTHLIEQFADTEREDHAKFDEFRHEEMFTPGSKRNMCNDCKYFDVKHMNLNTGIGCCQRYGVPVHNQSVKCEAFKDRDKLSIDDEPEPLNLRKNAAGVYIPQDQDSFMNPPYDDLLKQCEEYKIAYEHLEVHFQDAVGRIHILEREKDHMLNQLENRTKHITRQSNEIDAITRENDRLANENDKLDKENKKLVKRVQIQYEEIQKLRSVRFDYRQILRTVSHRLSTNASFTKKQIRDYVEAELKKDEGR